MANFWNQASVEPKRSFRYLLYFTGCPQFVVSKVSKPGFTVGNTPYQFLNYEFKYPGRVVWEDISMTIVDPVNPDSTASLYEILEQSGYTITTSYEEGAARTIGKSDMVSQLGNEIRIVQLDSDGTPNETWVLHNPLIKNVKFGELDYSQEGILNITLTLSIDWATLEDPSTDKWNLNGVSTNPSFGNEGGIG